MTEDSNYWKNRPLNDERKDWRNDGGNWVEEYVKSREHLHRKLIVDATGSFLLDNNTTILEIGCNTGPNISLIREEFSELKDNNLYGLDINKDSIRAAKSWMPKVNWKVGSALNLPYKDKSMDIVIEDACFMYLDSKEIIIALSEMDRVCRMGVVIVDWFSETESIKDFHWSRNYEVLLKDLGYKVKKIKITEKNWPSKNWAKNGYVFIGTKN